MPPTVRHMKKNKKKCDPSIWTHWEMPQSRTTSQGRISTPHDAVPCKGEEDKGADGAEPGKRVHAQGGLIPCMETPCGVFGGSHQAETPFPLSVNAFLRTRLTRSRSHERGLKREAAGHREALRNGLEEGQAVCTLETHVYDVTSELVGSSLIARYQSH